MEMWKKIKNGVSRGWHKLRSWPVVFHLLIIVLLTTILIIASQYVLSFGTRHNISRTVPDFRGLSVEHAERFAQPRDLQIVVSDSLYVPEHAGGIILDQIPSKGERVKPGRKIYVTINSFRQQEVSVPYVVGLSLREAKNRLERDKLTIAHLEYVDDEKVLGSKNNILAQFVNGREVTADTQPVVVCGTGITLQVSGYGQSTSVPELVGRPLAEAKSRLWEAGLNVGEVSCDKDMSMLEQNRAVVYQQSHMPKEEQPLGSYISLNITLNDEIVEEGKRALERRREELRLEQMRADSIATALAQDSIANMMATPPAVEDQFLY